LGMSTTPRTTIAPEVGAEDREELTPLYRVVLLDDDDHTYDYVIEMLQKSFCLFIGRSVPARRRSGYDGPHASDYLRIA
jgi:hypothetical protein